MKDILFFDTMVTPKIITFIYWIALVCFIVGGIYMLVSESFFLGLGIIIGGCIGSRMYCEIMIVLFKIYESLKTIAENGKA